MGCFSSAKYIQAIADARNISAASDQMGISQPALSAQLKKLEEHLGVLLFDRTKQPLEMTDAGRVYLRYALKYRALYNEMMQHIADIEDLQQGHLTVGGAGAFNVSYLPDAAAEFSVRYPGIEFEIVDGNIPDIAIKALNGQIDLFIAPPWKQDERFQYEELLREKIFLCVPPQWPVNEELKQWQIPAESVLRGDLCKQEMRDASRNGPGQQAKGVENVVPVSNRQIKDVENAARPLGQQAHEERDAACIPGAPHEKSIACTPIPQVDFTRFKNLPFVLLKEDQHIGHIMGTLFAKYGFEPQRYTVAEQTMTSYSLTLAGVGISLMTESTIRNSVYGRFPALYMADREICKRTMYVAYSKHKYLSGAAVRFIEILKDTLKNR